MSGRRRSPQSYQTTVMVNEALNELAGMTAVRRFGAAVFHRSGMTSRWQAIWPQDGRNVAANLRR
jgi:hypothetical protein